MPVAYFPSPESADEHGIVAWGGDLSAESLLLAYSQGIFPWPISPDVPLAWFSPNPRGILRFSRLHIPRSLMKSQKKSPLVFRFNTQFQQVVELCASVVRKNQLSTWITAEIVAGYGALFRQRYAYSAEAYDASGRLVAGIYGVTIGHYVSGESMFQRQTDASKLLLVYLCQQLAQRGLHWIDTQMVTSVVRSLGGEEIPRREFLALLGPLLDRPSVLSQWWASLGQ